MLMPSCSFNTGNKDIAKALLEAGALVDITDSEGRTPLIVACEKGYPHLVQLLVNHNADVNVTLCFGESPLHIACEKG